MSEFSVRHERSARLAEVKEPGAKPMSEKHGGDELAAPMRDDIRLNISLIQSA